MTFLDELRTGVGRLADFAELDVDTVRLPDEVTRLSDRSVREAFDTVAALSRSVQKLEAALVGVISQRSARGAGHTGLAQSEGFRTPVQMVQEITGVSRGEATRVVRVGAALVEAEPGGGCGAEGSGVDADGSDVAAALPTPWHRCVRDALIAGTLSQAQYDAIRRGLGEPPAITGRSDDEVSNVWRVAAEGLVLEASVCTVEELAASARAARDLLDPAGAEERWRRRYEERSFRLRTDEEGRMRGSIVFDDEGGAWWQSVLAAALRPRRGGPRFVAEGERDEAQQLVDDPRSNDQLAYDLIMDVFRAGALAEAKDVFGARQPGVRLVTLKDAIGPRDPFGRLLAVAHTEDGRVALPGSMLDRALCVTGSVEVTLDSCGNPLDVGPERRLFTPAQRIAIVARDGGCMWPGCDRPPSYTEVHHIDRWSDGGRTDVDRGILLCRHHHVHLHFAGWAIEREGKGRFLLAMPARDGGVGSAAAQAARAARRVPLQSKSPLRWMFDDPPETGGWRHGPPVRAGTVDRAG